MSKKEAVLGPIWDEVKVDKGDYSTQKICAPFYKYAVLEYGFVCEKNLPISNDMYYIC